MEHSGHLSDRKQARRDSRDQAIKNSRLARQCGEIQSRGRLQDRPAARQLLDAVSTPTDVDADCVLPARVTELEVGRRARRDGWWLDVERVVAGSGRAAVGSERHSMRRKRKLLLHVAGRLGKGAPMMRMQSHGGLV